ncbi:MAG: 50S ribosomal protein L11 methyltransferase, partial [Rickettsiales bacterium]|nr:50S ribosomal protein L11 methyltransferase [Rickettsiales bacterium]
MANPFMQPQMPMQVTIEAPPAVLDIMELRMEEVALTVTRMVDPVVPHITLIVDAPMIDTVQAIAAQVDAGAKVSVMKLADIDWVTQVQKDFPPFALGRFYVYGSHAKDTVPDNHYPLLIDAVAAFGTGEHATTAGCLLALQGVKRRRPSVNEVLDVGCGTVILGIGAARLWKMAHIEACDNDPMAVKVSRINLKANHIACRAKAWVSDGYKHRPIQKLPKQEVIVANILAKPLMKMARDAGRKLRGDGVLILSGL